MVAPHLPLLHLAACAPARQLSADAGMQVADEAFVWLSPIYTYVFVFVRYESCSWEGYVQQ